MAGVKFKELRMDTELLPQVRAGDDGSKKIVGYAVKWDRLSVPIFGMFREKFARGAFSDALGKGADVYASFQHNVSETIGRTPNTLRLEEDDTGLRYEIDPPAWFDKIESIERGDVRGSSFIFSLEGGKEEWDKTDSKMPIRTVLKAKLFEVSPVTSPAYPQTTSGVRSAEDYREELAEVLAPEAEPEPKEADETLERELNLLEIEYGK